MDITYDAKKRTIIGCVLVIVTVIATMFIYVYPIRSYYSQRQLEKLEKHRLSVLKEANSKMRTERRNLVTDEEIIKIAREQYRLVKPGEEAYIVSGQITTTTIPAK
ncbi:MAG: septum formation initiator family protein [Acidimicrobiia bacterium]